MTSKKFEKLMKDHIENQEKIGKTWGQALDRARDTIKRKNQIRKTEIREGLDKCRANEKELIDQILSDQKQINEEMMKLCIDWIQKKITGPPNGGQVNSPVDDMKARHLDRYWTDMNKDLNTIVDRQRDKMNRLEQEMTAQVSGKRGQKRLELMEKQKTLSDQRIVRSEETIRRVEQIRKEVVKIEITIEELFIQERDKLENLLNKSRITDHSDRERIWKKFMEECQR